MGSCIRVCEQSRVKYTLNPGSSSITSVSWSVAGGQLFSTTTSPHTATVNWGNAGNGALVITIYYANQTSETKTVCIEKIDGPEAKFEIAAVGGNEVCMNTPVYFDNLSTAGGGTGIVSYEWDFGDGSPTSSVFEPSHTYTSHGPKTVKLKVTNQCNCSKVYEMDINVNVANPIEISCASVVCAGSTETYTANNTCDGEWEVIGGTVQNINGNQITVEWNQVDPADGFGYVMYKSECGCPAWTTLKIPVVTQNAIIQGPTNACTGKQYKYSLPRWPTTQVQWNVNGPSNVQTTYNAQRNEVYLKFNAPGLYTLTAHYLNTLLRCEGASETLNILVTEPLTITGGQPEVCTGSSLTFNSNAAGNAAWQVLFNGSVIHTQTSVTLDYVFSNPGTYVIAATSPNGGCTGDGVVVKSLPIPPKPTGVINGPEPVCAGIPYTYTLNPTNAGFIPVWSVTGGTIQGSNTGPSVTVVFTAGAPQYIVRVANKSNNGLGCTSKNLSRILQKVDLSGIDIISPNPGNNTYCPSTTATFVANFNGIVPDNFNWHFESSNFGSLITDPANPNAIIVNFNEVSGGIYQTHLVLSGYKCGEYFEKKLLITLQNLPVISLNSGSICEGASSFNVTVNLPTNVSTGQLTFTFPNTTPVTVNVLPGGGAQTFNIPNHFVNSTNSIITQTLQVKLVAPNGCNYVATAAGTFTVKPELDVTITPGYYYTICPTSTYSVTLTGSIPSGVTGAIYQWYKDNAIIAGANGPTYTIDNTSQPSPAGSYQLMVMANGCPSFSQHISVTEGCGSLPPCNISPAPNLQVTATWTSCNTITATATYNGTPTSFTWSGSPFMTLMPGSNSNSATFTVEEAGVHSVILTMFFGTCKVQRIVDITKNYKPDFKSSITCNSNGTYNITLTDNSLLSGITSNQIAYSFIMSGGSQQNGQTVTYTGLIPGQQYAFAIKLDGPGTMPDCIYTENITMPAIPSTQFTVSQTTVCKGEKIILNIPPQNFFPDHQYIWHFANTAYIASGPETHITFNTANPNHSVYLEIRTPNNCIFTSNSVSVKVNEAKLYDGILTGNNLNVCATSSTQPQLYFIPQPTGYSQYIWMNGDQQVGTTSVPYFSPTQSGSYWVILRDALNGCLFKGLVSNPVAVTIRSTPNVSIVGNSQICQNGSVILQGIVTDSNLNYEWTRSYNGSPATVVQSGTTATQVVHNSGPLAVGTYVYTLKVWASSDPNCFGTSTFIVTVSAPPAAPQLQHSLVSCQPYKVKIQVTNPGNGTYNWSNGMTGSTIYVNTGGIYNVIYTAPSGCSSVQQIMVPHSLEDLMWIFPTGCYDLCPGDGYVIGPRGNFDGYEWQHFGSNQQGGSGLIDPYWPQQTGAYQLFLDHGGCQLTSGNMNIIPSVKNPNCPTGECKISAHIKTVKRDGNVFLIYGEIYNYGSQAITVTLTSASNSGVYQPSTGITIAPGGVYYMNPVIFYPGPNFTGVDTLMITGSSPECLEKLEVVMDKDVYTKASSSSVQTASQLKLVPNPAKDEVVIYYDTGSGQVAANTLYIYDRGGKLQHQQELSTGQGEVRLNVQKWLQGMYLVTITTDGDALQGKLLKE